MNGGAPPAQLGAELQQCGDLAESVGAEAVRFDHLVLDMALRSRLPPPEEDAERHRRREERSEGDESADEGHSRSG